jgi:hypothetical protein
MSTLLTTTTADLTTLGATAGIGDTYFNTTTNNIVLWDGSAWIEYINDGLALLLTPLLDTYQSATLGYSLRKLRNNYTGNCLRVRRASDNLEQDIGFSSGVIDTSTMETFVGTGDGFVVKWYDQSGNGRDATQTTASKQPKVVASGTTITSGSVPALEFNNNVLVISQNTFNQTTAFSVLAVAEFDITTQTEGHIIGVGSSSNGYLKSYGDKLGVVANGSDRELMYSSTSANVGVYLQDPTNLVDDTIFLGIFTNDGTTSKLTLDNGLPQSSSNSLNPHTGYTTATIGASDGSGNGSTGSAFRGKISECVQWHSSQDSNRSGIKTNINQYYSIW